MNPTWAGDLTGERVPLQLRYSAGLCTGFAFEPSHPGDMAPKLEIFSCGDILYRSGVGVKKITEQTTFYQFLEKSLGQYYLQIILIILHDLLNKMPPVPQAAHQPGSINHREILCQEMLAENHQP